VRQSRLDSGLGFGVKVPKRFKVLFLRSEAAMKNNYSTTDTGPNRFRNVKRFRGGLVFKAHRLCVSLNSRLESNKEEDGEVVPDEVLEKGEEETVSRMMIAWPVASSNLRFSGP